MPNAIAYLALILWPIVTFALFASMRPEKALIWSLMGGYLVLPVNTSFDFPGVPALDKTSIPNISALIGALLFSKGLVVRLPREWWVVALMGIYVVSPLFTVLTNRDAVQYGSFILPGLRPYDAFSAAAYKAIDLIPFVLGYNMLKDPRAQDYLLRALVLAALGYSLLMLAEIRLSPQLHATIYGFFPHSFAQQVRDGGFRPVVFLGHGLEVAIFTTLATIATAYLAKRRIHVFGISAWIWLAYLAIILVLCRSLGALVLGCMAVGMIFLVRQAGLRMICTVVAAVVLAYPILRGADIVPVQAIADQVATVSEERAESFQFRINNEKLLLDHANKRALFGWGGYGRNRVFDDTGSDLSVTDGTWIIIIGSNGWLGYIAAFGLLCLPVFLLGLKRGPVSAASAAVSLLLAVNLLDNLPNSSVIPFTWLMAGMLASRRRPSKRLAKPINRPGAEVDLTARTQHNRELPGPGVLSQ
ncbi:MAG: hypothetical protein V2I43_00595 [Parvularcula sp.]|jgi:hypothetical protein|nr:hypothetical protein [Parvularcula sp.]